MAYVGRNAEIVEYYDGTVDAYRLVWRCSQAMALHYGFWEPGRCSCFRALSGGQLVEALRRENRQLAAWAQIEPSDVVLDAGCGVGGSAIQLASEIGCEVHGITLSGEQVKVARSNAKAAGSHVEALTRFDCRDYTCTGLKPRCVSVVWAVESVCHANDKRAFIDEASRLLRKKGRLMVADYFLTKEEDLPEDEALLEKWLNGWAIQRLVTAERFRQELSDAGFRNIQYRDVTELIFPSALRLYLVHLFTDWVLTPLLVNLLGLRPWGLDTAVEKGNIIAARCQFEALRRGLWRYGVFIAER